MSVFSLSAEIKALIDDLGLIPLSSLEAQSALSFFSNRDRFAEMDFSDEIFQIESARYPNLSEMYYKYNRKGSRRCFGCSLELQLTLDF